MQVTALRHFQRPAWSGDVGPATAIGYIPTSIVEPPSSARRAPGPPGRNATKVFATDSPSQSGIDDAALTYDSPMPDEEEPPRIVVLITGAGASRGFGLDGASLPIMSEWATSLCAALDNLERDLAQAMHLAPAMPGEEFEETLGKFLHLDETLDVVRLFEHLGGGNDDPLTAAHPITTWVSQVEMRRPRIRDCISANLWDEFGLKRIDVEAATVAFRSILNALGVGPQKSRVDSPSPHRTPPTKLISATTNYDRMQEVAYSNADPDRLTCDVGGRRESTASSLYLAADEVLNLDPAVVTHLHLHGAVGWYRDGNRIRIDGADQPLQPGSDPAVLYPDPNKDPTSSDGHDALWAAFTQALSKATDIVVLGHSLHDMPIVNAIAAAPDARLLVSHRANPSSEKQLRARLDLLGLSSRADLISMDFGPEPNTRLLEQWAREGLPAD